MKQLDLFAEEQCTTPFGAMAKHFANTLRNGGMSGGPRTSNTGASKCVDDSDDITLFESLPQGGGGIDAISCSVYGTFKLLDFYREKFEGCQLAARAGKLAESIFWHKGQVFLFTAGGGGKGIAHHPFRVQCDGVSLIFGARAEAKSGPPLMMVQVMGEPFLLRGEVAVFEAIEKMLDVLGVVVDRVSISRIDGCVDLPNVSIDELWKYLDTDSFYGRAKVFTWKGNDGSKETVGLQSRSMMLRVYEKSKECTDVQKRAAMIANRWGCDPEQAVRIEFEVHRECLVDQVDCADFRTVLQQLGNLFKWGVMCWCRLVDKFASRSTDSPIATIWLRVARAFDYWCGRLEQRTAVVMPPLDIEGLLSQLWGCATSMFARLNVRPESWAELHDLLTEFVPASDCSSIVLAKVAKLKSEGRLDVGECVTCS